MLWNLFNVLGNLSNTSITTNHDYTYQVAEAFKVPASPEMNTALVGSSHSCET